MEEGEVAESKRRGEDAVDEHLDEVFVDADDDDDFADDLTAGAGTVTRRGSSAATRAKTARDQTPAKTAKTAIDSPGFFDRIARFFREVVAELRKVNWPSRKELLTYTTVVVVFVVIMMSIVGGLDWAFAWLVTHVFG
jgi:preprotein translocase subunit SecE